MPEPSISYVNESAILLRFAEHDHSNTEAQPDPALQLRICQLAQALRSHPDRAAMLQEVVPGPGNLLLVMHRGVITEQVLQHAESLWLEDGQIRDESALIEIPVSYGGKNGPDLTQLSRHTGLDVNEIIQRHSAPEYLVQCLGFMAGFAYLGGLDTTLAIPRKKTPATSIPAGAVAIGDHYTGIYPSATPGGWHIIGHTPSKLFDPQGNPPCLLKPGDRVRFVPVETRS
ncbi:MAG TPA: 5-oxoprolinase subunit PxpB [Pseudohongiella sp.]|nr:5-oxoprolinase subunit PxpB [Pseudohongiella sp.]HEA63866.1 5-oxoprolinase subunit PxpB [Pseudohongiella sp.]